MSEYEDWADERAQQTAEANSAAISAIVSLWIARSRADEEQPMSAEEFNAALARQVDAANDLCWRAGDVAIAALASEHAGTKVPPMGLHSPPEDVERLAEAVDTIFSADEERIVDRMERLAAAEPRRAAKESLRRSMLARGVEEWVRVVQPDACEACASMVGQLHPIEVQFFDHPNCHCSLRARIPQGWGDEVRARAFQLRRVTPSGVRLSTGIQFSNVQRGSTR